MDRDSIWPIQLTLSNSTPVNGNDELNELYRLTIKAGYDIDSEIFKVLLDFIKLNVNPAAITRSLQKIIAFNTFSK